MKDYTEINKWTAEKCGVALYAITPVIHSNYKEYDYLEKGIEQRWSIERAECREIIREKFLIRTVFNDSDYVWKAYCLKPFIEPNGKTIAEAEIACIVAIWEKEK